MLGISFGSAARSRTTRPRQRRGRRPGVRRRPGGPRRACNRATWSRASTISRSTTVDALQLAVSVLPPVDDGIRSSTQRDGRAATAQVKLAKLAVAGKTIATVRPESWRGIRVDYATALEAASLLAGD